MSHSVSPVTRTLLLPAPLKTALEAKIKDIATSLEQYGSASTELGLLTGKPGIAIFYFYLYRFTQDERYADLVSAQLIEAFDILNSGEKNHRFCTGIGGFCWTLEFLADEGFLDREEVEEPLAQLDEFISRSMMEDMEEGYYDYLHGALGTGLYYLRQIEDVPAARQHLERLIGQLERFGIRDGDGTVKWESQVDIETGMRGFNLSLSHGLASIIYFLSKALNAQVSPERTRTLLEESVRYMLSKEQSMTEVGSAFPSWITTEKPGKSRLSWCYGDMGIAFSLYEAARALGDTSLEEKALEILSSTCSRRKLEEEFVMDAGLCHGAAGLAHMYNRMYRNTGKEIFADASRFWLQETLKMATFPDGMGGYKTWKTEKYGGWLNEAGVLEGAAGIGLALLAAVSESDPAWDACLCLS